MDDINEVQQGVTAAVSQWLNSNQITCAEIVRIISEETEEVLLSSFRSNRAVVNAVIEDGITSAIKSFKEENREYIIRATAQAKKD